MRSALTEEVDETTVRRYVPKTSVSAATSAWTALAQHPATSATAKSLRAVFMGVPPVLGDPAVELVHLGEAPLEQRPQVAETSERDLLPRAVAVLAGGNPAVIGVQEEDVVIGGVGVRGE